MCTRITVSFAIALLFIGGSINAQQNCRSTSCPQVSATHFVTQPARQVTAPQPAAKPATKQAIQKMQGWANVPGGVVWLEPGRQAYEHDTGLVRDLATGQKSYPITPQSLAQVPVQPQPVYRPPTYVRPQQPVYVAPQPLVYSPYVQPVPVAPMQPLPNPYYNPNYNPRYDTGPYGPGGCYDCGAIATSRTGSNSIANRWPTVGSLPK